MKLSKTSAIFCSAILAFSLAACGEGDKDGEKIAENSSSSSSTPTPSAVDTPPALTSEETESAGPETSENAEPNSSSDSNSSAPSESKSPSPKSTPSTPSTSPTVNPPKSSKKNDKPKEPTHPNREGKAPWAKSNADVGEVVASGKSGAVKVEVRQVGTVVAKSEAIDKSFKKGDKVVVLNFVFTNTGSKTIPLSYVFTSLAATYEGSKAKNSLEFYTQDLLGLSNDPLKPHFNGFPPYALKSGESFSYAGGVAYRSGKKMGFEVTMVHGDKSGRPDGNSGSYGYFSGTIK